jgi:hypothetical protein
MAYIQPMLPILRQQSPSNHSNPIAILAHQEFKVPSKTSLLLTNLLPSLPFPASVNIRKPTWKVGFLIDDYEPVL